MTGYYRRRSARTDFIGHVTFSYTASSMRENTSEKGERAVVGGCGFGERWIASACEIVGGAGALSALVEEERKKVRLKVLDTLFREAHSPWLYAPVCIRKRVRVAAVARSFICSADATSPHARDSASRVRTRGEFLRRDLKDLEAPQPWSCLSLRHETSLQLVQLQ